MLISKSEKMKKWYFALSLLIIQHICKAQSGTIQGIVYDENKQTVIGATISVMGTSIGTKTNVNGQFQIRNLNDGTFQLQISYVSYKTIKQEVSVKNGKSDSVVINLEREQKNLKEVQVKSQMKKESMQSLLVHQKNLATISDGISADLIKKTSDRSTSEVLKRVSGVTIVDNRYAVIRGLADRYNLALMNGDILPSSESDKKAFSFDLIPSAMVDRISIVKTASPDKPAEFAGGIIDISTKEVGSDNFLQIQIGSGGNSLSALKQRSISTKSSTDWLGFDNSQRILPSSFPSTDKFLSSSSAFSKNDRLEASKTLKNNWEIKEGTTPLNQSLGISGGYSHKFKKEQKLGVISSLNYNRFYRTHSVERKDLNGTEYLYNFQDNVYKESTLLGALVNVSFKWNDNHKVQFKNMYSATGENQTILRSGKSFETQQDIKSNAGWYTSNQLLSNALSGEHQVSKQKIKIQWSLNRQAIVRNIPDLRKFQSAKNYDDSVYRAYIPLKGSPFYSGTFYAKTKETIYTGSLDIQLPYTLFNAKQWLKGGVYIQSKERNYDARVLGFKVSNLSKYNNQIELLPQEQLFTSANMTETGIMIDDITQPSDAYQAESKLQAAYLLSENKIGNNVRVVWGARAEQFEQQITTGFTKANDKTIEKKNTNILPSLNITYALDKKTNLRACWSQTLSRPEFRELAPAAFYNYNMLLTYVGNESLLQTQINNYDLRYEYFMGKGEMLSASIFYKKFKNPIESVMDLSTKLMSYANAPEANLFGAEIEVRKNLGFLTNAKKSFLNDLSVFGNLAYIKSEVQIEYHTVDSSKLIQKRRMQGQSPYIINGGLSYQHPTYNIGITVVYNRIGERIVAVGNQTIVPDLYEAPRNILDLQLSKKIKKNFEIKCSLSDLLASPIRYYYNMNSLGQANKEVSYKKEHDFLFMNQQQGRNLSLNLSYTF